jgi:ABC-type multidrug transport system ATPase subunit
MNRSALDTLILETKCSPQTARNRLGAFKFSGNDVFKLVRELSGGERSRLRLCILMSAEINFLILDEPTNHLDIPSREWIEDAVADYEGTLLFVSHDRYFTEKFATRIWELENGVFTDYPRTFGEYQAIKAAAALPASEAKKQSGRGLQEAEPAARPKKQNRRDNTRIINLLEREISEIEKKIAELEALRYEHASDYKRLLEIDSEHAELSSVMETKLAEWEAAST